MHVLIITPAYPHSGNSTEGLFNEQHALALVQKGIEVTVVVCKPWLPDGLTRIWRRYSTLADLPKAEERNGIRVHYARYLHIPGYKCVHVTVASCARSILQTVNQVNSTKRYSIIQVHDAWPAGLAATAVAAALNIPFVVTMHIQDEPLFLRRRRSAELYEEMIAQTSSIIVVGRPLERFARGWMYGEDGSRVRVIPNGVDLEAVEDAAGKDSRTQDGWGNILSVCNLWPVKGIDQNLKALKKLDGMGVPWKSYAIVGDGPEKLRLTKLAANLGIADRVRFHGRLPHREVLREMVRCDIFSLPSWQEAFGVVYLEAMACGKPVIGCRGQGAEEMIQHERTGILVAPGDVSDLTSALRRLLENPECGQKLGEAAISRAREFTWESNASQYVHLYEEIRGNRPVHHCPH